MSTQEVTQAENNITVILNEADGITNETRVCSITQQRIGGLFSKIGTELVTLDAAKETPKGAQDKASKAQRDAERYTDTKVANLVDSSPGTLNTLNELAAALGNDANFATTITNTLSLKANAEEVANTYMSVLCAGTKNLTTSDTFSKLRGVNATIGSGGVYKITHNYKSMNYVVIASSPESSSKIVQVKEKTPTYFTLYVHDPILNQSCNGQIDFVAFKI